MIVKAFIAIIIEVLIGFILLWKSNMSVDEKVVGSWVGPGLEYFLGFIPLLFIANVVWVSNSIERNSSVLKRLIYSLIAIFIITPVVVIITSLTWPTVGNFLGLWK